MSSNLLLLFFIIRLFIITFHILFDFLFRYTTKQLLTIRISNFIIIKVIFSKGIDKFQFEAHYREYAIGEESNYEGRAGVEEEEAGGVIVAWDKLEEIEDA